MNPSGSQGSGGSAPPGRGFGGRRGGGGGRSDGRGEGRGDGLGGGLRGGFDGGGGGGHGGGPGAGRGDGRGDGHGRGGGGAFGGGRATWWPCYVVCLDNPPRRAIVASIRRHFDGTWYNISSVPNEAIMQWWGSFIQSFYWDDAYGGEVYHMWYHVLAGRLRDMISKAKVSGNKPEWISGEIWELMVEYWGTDAARKRSKIASDNCLSCRDGFGPHEHTSGSHSYDQLRELIRRKEGIEPSMLRILRETHRKADGSYVDDKARSIEEEIQREIDAISHM